MCDEWMPVLQIPMGIDQFHQLPRHPAYKYEYLHDHALLTPRARFYHARLLLSRHSASADLEPAEPFDVSLLRDEEMDELKKVFVASFAGHQPFASLDADTRARAAHQCLEKTRTGADGPWLRQASFVARAHKDQSVAGAILITLMPDGDAREYDSYYWNEPAPGDLIETRGGRPHLTWVFVRPWLAGQGAGTALLHAAVQGLSGLGYRELFSTFLLGNHASTMWHWRHGFELLSHPYSIRRMRREIRGKGRE